jgi:hypothetical protein
MSSGGNNQGGGAPANPNVRQAHRSTIRSVAQTYVVKGGGHYTIDEAGGPVVHSVRWVPDDGQARAWYCDNPFLCAKKASEHEREVNVDSQFLFDSVVTDSPGKFHLSCTESDDDGR